VHYSTNIPVGVLSSSVFSALPSRDYDFSSIVIMQKIMTLLYNRSLFPPKSGGASSSYATFGISV
jgi:hypothetical protein